MPRPISLVVDTPGTFKDSKGGHVLCFVFRNNLAFNVLFIYGGLHRNLAANNYSHCNARYIGTSTTTPLATPYGN